MRWFDNMASIVIHMAVAKRINDALKRDYDKVLYGSIAPDISQCLGEPRKYSHFLNDDGLPDVNRFLEKYGNKLDDDFVLGYFIHLYTDYFWFNYFITELVSHNVITKLNGDSVKLNGNMLRQYIYNDYTNLNVLLINKYSLDFEFLYSDEVRNTDILIDEIPSDKMNVLFDKAVSIVQNSKVRKSFVFDIDNIDRFISMSVNLILNEIESIG